MWRYEYVAQGNHYFIYNPIIITRGENRIQRILLSLSIMINLSLVFQDYFTPFTTLLISIFPNRFLNIIVIFDLLFHLTNNVWKRLEEKLDWLPMTP